MSGNGKTLIINPGSSSLKFRLYEGNKILIDKSLEEIVDFSKAVSQIIKEIEKHDIKTIKKVVYRVVYGNGKSPSIIDSKMMKKMEGYVELAPLHMKISNQIIKEFMKKINAKHFACFDSSFHQSMPEYAKIYALPSKLSDKYGIRRYGFHGISHSGMLNQVKKMTGKSYSKVITIQLGNGASVCAIEDEKSIETSMGFTPLEGLMMGSRSGNIDPAIIPYLCKKERKSPEQILYILEKESGLIGIAGENSVRKLIIRMKKGDKKAKLALEMFCHRVRMQIGSYIAILGGVDLIVLGGGICRAPYIRKKILSGLEEFGIKIDKTNIEKETPVRISSGKVEIYAVETDEQQEMFEMTKNL